MKKNYYSIQLIAMVFVSLFFQKAYSQINLSATSATLTGSYTNLRSAFAKINDGTHQGTIVITITDNSTDNATAVLNASGSGSANYSSVLIYPTVAGKSIDANINAPVIQLNGADNVTIDGRLNATGTTPDLFIRNVALIGGAINGIQFINDASNNTIKYCNIKSGGGTMVNQGGIISFSTTTGTTGNDNNIIEYNNLSSISDDNRPMHGILSYGTASYENSGNIIRNNNIFDFLEHAYSGSGIYITANSTDFEITGNSFYETTEFIPSTSDRDYYIIYINSGAVGNNYKINNNYIGGSAPQCGGTNKWRKTNAFKNNLYAIYIGAGITTASNVQGNTIKNISWHNPTYSTFYGIYAQSGIINIGTTEGNTIGSSTENDVIELKSDANAQSYGIYINNATADIRNNKIGGFSLLNPNNTYYYNFAGVYMGSTAYAFKCIGNTIGSTSVANNINATSMATGGAQEMYGILCYASNNNTITDNTIANISNSSSNSTLTTRGKLYGIYASAGICTIANNTVRDLKTHNANDNKGSATSLAGIMLYNSGSSVCSISNNTVYNLTNYYDNYAGSVIGIYYVTYGTSCDISRNYVHSLNVNGANSTTSEIQGIYAYGNLSIYNNVINLNNTSKSDVYGLKTSVDKNTNVYFNTVFLKGNAASGTNPSYAYHCVFDQYSIYTNNVKNNIFCNTKSTTGGNNLHYAAYFYHNLHASGTFALDYNDYIANGAGGVLGYFNYTSVPTLPIKAGQDANSLVKDPVFANPSGLNAADLKPTTPLKGTAIASYSTDYEFQALLSPPSMGAFKGVACQNATNGGTIAGTQTICYNSSPTLFTNESSPSGNNSTLVYKWQKSTTSGTAGFSDIGSSNAATYQSAALTQDTWFKRLAISDCADWSGAVESNVIKVTVSPSTIGGSITSATTTITYGASSGTMTLESHVGTIQKWQKKLNTGTWSDITNTDATYSETPTAAGTWYYRAVVKSGACSETNSSEFTLTVNKKQLTVINASVTTKEYDGNTNATITNATLSGKIIGDDVTLENATIGTFNNKTVADNKTVTTSMTLNGTNKDNYTLQQPSLTGNITARSLTVTNVTVHNKVYNGNTNALINASSASWSGYVSGDDVNLINTTTGTFDNKNVGTNKVVSNTISINGTDATNYIFTKPSLTGNILSKALSVNNATVTTKEYDGNTNAEITGATLANFIIGDDINLTNASSGEFNNKNVGNNKAVSTNFGLSGGDVLNYIINQSSLYGNITAKNLNVINASVTTKEYDGNTNATITGASLSGKISGDDVSLDNATSGTFNNKNVGTNKTVSHNMNISGVDATNYNFVSPTLTGEITTKALSVTNAEVTTKEYDGNDIATITGATLSGKVIGDDVVLQNASAGTFDNKNVGNNKTVSNTMNIAGADITNYNFTAPSLTGNITAKNITAINASVTTKVYDGNTTASISNAELSGVILSDVVTLENATIGSFDNKNVGTNKVVNSAMSITGTDAINYQFVQPTLTGTITTKELTIGGNFTVLDKVHDGNDTATINQNNLTLVGKILNDNVDLNYIIVNFAQTAIGTNIVVSITHAELDGTDKNNYTLSLNAAPTATASITTGSNVNLVNKNIINLYPNPFKNIVYTDNVQNIKKIQITNIAGQLVLEKNLINEKLISTENLENGVYFIHIETNHGEKQIFKMIKH